MEMYIGFPGGKRVDAEYKGFIIKTDQPVKDGGENSAPAPFDLFLASIGTCTGVYVLSFCENRKIPSEQIKLILSTKRNKDTGMISKIDLDLQVPPDFPPEYKEAIIRTAGLCTVKKHILNPPEFDIKLSVK